MTTKPGDGVAIQFTISDPATGAAINADSLPTGTLVRNGDNTAETVTISNISTGVYKAAVTIPVGYAAGDEVQLRIAATVSTIAAERPIWGDTLDSKRVGELVDLTAQQVWEYATRTLTGFGSLVADVAAAVWSYLTRTLTQSAASVAAVVVGDEIAVTRGTTWVIALTGLGSLANYDTIYFSVKWSVDDDDDAAVLRVKNAASGLERFNGAAPTATTNGTIAVDDTAAGDITITIQEEETQNAPLGSGLSYDVKGVDADGNTDEVSRGVGQFDIAGDVTRKIA